jgi:hypothetical protein
VLPIEDLFCVELSRPRRAMLSHGSLTALPLDQSSLGQQRQTRIVEGLFYGHCIQSIDNPEER